MSHGPILQFTRNSKANCYLNSVAYTDGFLKKLVQEFKERQLMVKKLLFVFLGDHGIHEQYLGSGETQTTNVAVTCHTQEQDLVETSCHD